MKGVWALTIVLAFAAGSLVTGAAVFADDDGPGNDITTYSRSSSVDISPQGFETTSVFCNVGDQVTGGGVRSDIQDIYTVVSAPTGSNPPTGWIGSAENAGYGDGTMTVYVVCIDK